MSDRNAPLVVVGAGPVGLAAALVFARTGVPVVVLEADGPALRTEWRGSTLHPPTLELLDLLGIADAAASGGVRVDRLQFRDLEAVESATFDYSLLSSCTRFPFRLQFEQYKLMRLLRDAADRTPLVEIRFGHRLTGLEQDADHAVLTVEDAAGEPVVLRARWVLGADGARSTVRELCSLAFDGDTYPTMSLVAATRFPFEKALDDLAPVSYWTGPSGRLSLIRTPDIWRVAMSTGDSSDDRPADLDPARPHPAFADALDCLLGGRAWAETPLEQHRLYRSHQRVASAFRAGRVLLAGDAAHLSSTTGGMGLNSGLHDVFDLAQRLGPPLADGDAVAESAAANRYAETRRAVAEEIVQPATRTVRSGIDTTSLEGRQERLAGLCALADDSDAAAHHLWQLSMFDSAPTTGLLEDRGTKDVIRP
ncbi:FAD-dependent oxidoreductase [Streptomyces sp. NPDC052042]|uniref:FAD-dependent oxidoreductase n=1 Tax=Streptomyces sp. NPDC052042 TaxID=3365683 RepID=UPI0037D08A81